MLNICSVDIITFIIVVPQYIYVLGVYWQIQMTSTGDGTVHTVHQKPMLSVQTWMFETEKKDPISRRLDWNMFYVYIIVYKNDSFSILQLLVLYSFSIEGLLVHYTTCRLIKKHQVLED